LLSKSVDACFGIRFAGTCTWSKNTGIRWRELARGNDLTLVFGEGNLHVGKGLTLIFGGGNLHVGKGLTLIFGGGNLHEGKGLALEFGDGNLHEGKGLALAFGGGNLHARKGLALVFSGGNLHVGKGGNVIKQHHASCLPTAAIPFFNALLGLTGILAADGVNFPANVLED